MIDTYEFLNSVLNTVADHIVVIDHTGEVRFKNAGWVDFRENERFTADKGRDGLNYLKVCDESAKKGDEFGRNAAEGIRKVIETGEGEFYLEYPSHSPEEKQWFLMRVSPFTLQGVDYYVISHHNITDKKLAEERAQNLSRIDGLTNIPNRRKFEEFLSEEWKRCARLELPITLAIINIDHFKVLNDTYGHQAGDDCLKRVGAALHEFCRRPGDLCARYGGDEFVMVMGDTTTEKSVGHVNKMLDAIRGLQIDNANAPTGPLVTASIGFATILPDYKNNQSDLIKAADELLYDAKENGRNQAMC